MFGEDLHTQEAADKNEPALPSTEGSAEPESSADPGLPTDVSPIPSPIMSYKVFERSSSPSPEYVKSGSYSADEDDFDENAEPSKRTAALRQANAPPGTQPQTNSAQPPMPPMQKRADNSNTAGGNSFTGGAGNTSGGGVSNYADDGSIQNKPGGLPA